MSFTREYITMISRFFLSGVSLITFLCDFHVSGCATNCTDKPVFSPSVLVVRYGDPAAATCFPCQSDCSNKTFNVETSVGERQPINSTVLWQISRLTEWGIRVQCYSTDYTTGDQCCTDLPITLYKPPDRVSISVYHHTGPMFAGHQYILLCKVHNVAPVENLAVTFYRGQTLLGQPQFSSNVQAKPMTETYNQIINPSKEDDGAQYWCEAELQLGPEGPQRPPVVISENITTTVYYEPQLQASAHLNKITITEGDSLHLNCSAVGNPTPSYNWTLPLPLHPHPVGSVVTIEPVGPEHEGTFTCSIRNTVGSVEATFNVEVREPPSVSLSVYNHTGPMFAGHQYILLCIVHNVAPAKNLAVTFYRGQTPLGQPQFSNNTQTKPVTESFTQIINPSKEDDGAQYWCEAEIQLGPEGKQRPPVVISENITTTVYYEPQLEASAHSNKVTVTEGDSLHLNCSAVGNPTPSYNWTLPLPLHPHPVSSVVTIEPVGPEHEGTFTCSVRNTVGSVEATFNVEVREPPDRVSLSVYNHTGPMFAGHQYILLCNVHNVAPAKNLAVTFYRGQTPLGQPQFSNNTQTKPVTESFTQIINPSKEDDGAQYWCEAEIQLGPEGKQRPPVVISENIDTIVFYEPQLEASAHSNKITITEGDPLHLNCSAVGNPTPSYNWTLPLPLHPHPVSSVVTIEPVGPEHEGTFTCSVRNTVGSVEASFNVEVRANHTSYIIAPAVIAGVLILAGVLMGYSYYSKQKQGQYDVVLHHVQLTPMSRT